MIHCSFGDAKSPWNYHFITTFSTGLHIYSRRWLKAMRDSRFSLDKAHTANTPCPGNRWGQVYSPLAASTAVYSWHSGSDTAAPGRPQPPAWSWQAGRRLSWRPGCLCRSPLVPHPPSASQKSVAKTHRSMLGKFILLVSGKLIFVILLSLFDGELQTWNVSFYNVY